MSLYLDASAIVPTLVRESASPAVESYLLAATETLLVSEFSAAETASALSRLVRTRHLTASQADDLLGEFDAWRAAATLDVDIRSSDFRLASLIVRRLDLALRAPDALHLAVCRRDDHLLLTMDRRMVSAAGALGVRCECPA